MINRSAKELDNNMEIHLHDCRLKIGETIREIREKKGYNQEQLADIMNVSRTTISKIENGKFNFSIDYLSKFSWFLDFNISILTNRK
ncbi:helix-turn-helix domain-containing protein [Flavobacterium hibernum]|jgi:transcriptional regulator with XRE-family HTH domain|nr:helix-turn-helix transcriptional regulator [Flavobacterium hibernum]STO10718.1 HTH-type transcriptional regulator sinR [Flavobacterium hibernum]